MWSSNWLVRCESIIYYYFDSFDELNVIRFILSFEFGKGRNRQWMNEESESKKKNLEQMKNRTRECQSCMHWPLRQVQYSTVEKVHKQWLNSSQKCKIANHGQNNWWSRIKNLRALHVPDLLRAFSSVLTSASDF
jgi:hypothetical protein